MDKCSIVGIDAIGVSFGSKCTTFKASELEQGIELGSNFNNTDYTQKPITPRTRTKEIFHRQLGPERVAETP